MSVVGGRPTGWVVGVLVCLPPVRGGLAGFPSRTPQHTDDGRRTKDERPMATLHWDIGLSASVFGRPTGGTT
jgi:hypothetical protein